MAGVDVTTDVSLLSLWVTPQFPFSLGQHLCWSKWASSLPPSLLPSISFCHLSVYPSPIYPDLNPHRASQRPRAHEDQRLSPFPVLQPQRRSPRPARWWGHGSSRGRWGLRGRENPPHDLLPPWRGNTNKALGVMEGHVRPQFTRVPRPQMSS